MAIMIFFYWEMDGVFILNKKRSQKEILNKNELHQYATLKPQVSKLLLVR